MNQRCLQSSMVKSQLASYPDAKVVYLLPYSTKLLVTSVAHAVKQLGLPWDTTIMHHAGYGSYQHAPVMFLTEGSYVTAETNPIHPGLKGDLAQLFELSKQYKVLCIFVYPQWATDIIAKPSVNAQASGIVKAWYSVRNFMKFRHFVYTNFYDVLTFSELLRTVVNSFAPETSLTPAQTDMLLGLTQAIEHSQFNPSQQEQLIDLITHVCHTDYLTVLRRRNSKEPRLSRSQTIDNVLKCEPVQEAILNCTKKQVKDIVKNSDELLEQHKKAQEIVQEIASDVRFGMLKKYDIVLKRLWNRFYSGIHIRGLDRLIDTLYKNDYASLVYVSTHRSHIDYLLLSYILNEWGAMKPPNIAAGINLNFFPIGGIFRKGGAFFLRRSFNNYLYSVIFKSYIAELIRQHQDIEFFIEGGRSRTGRLLVPKTGVLNMTIEGFLRNPQANMFYVPVFICYDKVFESATYVNELRGKKKSPESMWLVLKNLRKVKYQGHVHVNFARPVLISHYFDRLYPNWVQDVQDNNVDRTKVDQVSSALTHYTMVSINANATVSDNALFAAAIYQTTGKFQRERLTSDIDFLRQVLQETQLFNPEFEISQNSTKDILTKVLRVAKKHILIDTEQQITIKPRSMPEFNYYRNNIEHCFIAPALASLMLQQDLTDADLATFNHYFSGVFNRNSFTDFQAQDLVIQVKHFKNVLATTTPEQLSLLSKQISCYLQQIKAILTQAVVDLESMQAEEKNLEHFKLSKVVTSVVTQLKDQHNPYPDYTDKTTINQLRLAISEGTEGVIDFTNLASVQDAVVALSQWLSLATCDASSTANIIAETEFSYDSEESITTE